MPKKRKAFKLTHYPKQKPLDFRFLFAIVPLVEELGKRLAAPLPP